MSDTKFARTEFIVCDQDKWLHSVQLDNLPLHRES